MIVDSVAVLDLVCRTVVAQVQTLHEILGSITASETLLQIQQKRSFCNWSKKMAIVGFTLQNTKLDVSKKHHFTTHHSCPPADSSSKILYIHMHVHAQFNWTTSYAYSSTRSQIKPLQINFLFPVLGMASSYRRGRRLLLLICLSDKVQFKVAGNLHFKTSNNRYFSEDRIHGETSYHCLAQRWSTAGVFWSSRGRIIALNNMSAICPESVVA